MKKSIWMHIVELLVKYDVLFLEEIKNCDTYDEYIYLQEDTIPEYVMPFEDWNYLKETEYEIYEEIERQNKRRCKI